jgi:beta-galactosidase
MQNPIDEHRSHYPQRIAVGTEETTGCGTRGIYYPEPGRMAALNRAPDTDGTLNRIERGWQFYRDRPWLGGLFYWTGFDYRGEPNPLEYPATGSEFGILDYCGFPKDEAWYLKAWWTDEPVLHILPHWNLEGHEGEKVSIWAYSNCDEVSLSVNGKNLGRKKMPRGGHIEWEAVYQPGKVVAKGYKDGRCILKEVVETAGAPSRVALEATTIGPLTVYTVRVLDHKGRWVPTACVPLSLTVDGPARILGAGNGDPAFRSKERPEDPSARSFSIETFGGLAQVLVQGTGHLSVQLEP